jgi:hypothetical protein
VVICLAFAIFRRIQCTRHVSINIVVVESILVNNGSRNTVQDCSKKTNGSSMHACMLNDVVWFVIFSESLMMSADTRNDESNVGRKLKKVSKRQNNKEINDT